MSNKHSNADARPRIYIDADDTGCRWRNGWHGREKHTATAGQALDAALDSIGNADAVIFFRKMPGDEG